MPVALTATASSQEALLAALVAAVPSLSPVAATRAVAADAFHARLEDGQVLVVRDYGHGRALGYGPDDYAGVDPAQVRDSAVAALWDVSGPWS